MNLRYPIRIEPDPEGGYLASHPDLSGCNAFGETIQEAVKSLEESREIWLESYYEAHHEAPEPSKPREFSGRLLVRMPKYLHEKLHESAEAEGLSLNQYILSLLAERNERRKKSVFYGIEQPQRAAHILSEAAATIFSYELGEWLPTLDIAMTRNQLFFRPTYGQAKSKIFASLLSAFKPAETRETRLLPLKDVKHA